MLRHAYSKNISPVDSGQPLNAGRKDNPFAGGKVPWLRRCLWPGGNLQRFSKNRRISAPVHPPSAAVIAPVKPVNPSKATPGNPRNT